MFLAKRAMFTYAVSPVHMGAGTALGLIDNPIQRERHTGHPVLAGSGLKGALRHAAADHGMAEERREAVFGPAVETEDAGSFAGAVSLGDGVLLLFPVRSLKRSFVYATSATCLARARRVLCQAGSDPGWPVEEPAEGTAHLASPTPANDGGRLVLEAFAYEGKVDEDLAGIAKWLADNALPEGEHFDGFRDKLRKDLVLLPEDDFCHFVHNATAVEPHVRINDTTGTADEGGLFYTENLPPESLLVSLVMASQDRRPGATNGMRLKAGEIADELAAAFDGGLVQIGGDATTGRGLVALRFWGGEP